MALEVYDPYTRSAPAPPGGLPRTNSGSKLGQRLKIEIGGGRGLPEALTAATPTPSTSTWRDDRSREHERVRRLEAELESAKALTRSQEGRIDELLRGKDALLLEAIGEKRVRLQEAEAVLRSPGGAPGAWSAKKDLNTSNLSTSSAGAAQRPSRARSPHLGSMLKPLNANRPGTPGSLRGKAGGARAAAAAAAASPAATRSVSASAASSTLPQTAATAATLSLQKKLADLQQKNLLLEAEVKQLAQGKDDVLRDMIDEKQARVRDREEIMRLRDLLDEKQGIKGGRARVGVAEAGADSHHGGSAADAALIRRLQDEVVDLRRAKTELMEELIQEKKLHTRDRDEILVQLRAAERKLDEARNIKANMDTLKDAADAAARSSSGAPPGASTASAPAEAAITAEKPTAPADARLVRAAEEAMSSVKAENRDLRDQLLQAKRDLQRIAKAHDATLLDVIAEKQARIADAEQLLLVREELKDCRAALETEVLQADRRHQQADVRVLRKDIEDEIARLTAYA